VFFKGYAPFTLAKSIFNAIAAYVFNPLVDTCWADGNRLAA
jgi:hypothetical protein